MERLRSPSSSDAHTPALDSVGLPSLATLREAVRAPGVTSAKVDALLQGLASPLALDEAPRDRADLLLSLLESEELGSLKGSDGVTVRVAAVEALLALGYPYALEVPPEALVEARRAHPLSENSRRVPVGGLLVALVALVTQGLASLPGALLRMGALDGSGGISGPGLLLGLALLGLLLGPVLAAVFGGWWRLRFLQAVGVVLMALLGAGWMAFFILAVLLPHAHVPDGMRALSLLAGLSQTLGAFLLRHPEWSPPDTRQDPDASSER